MDLKKILLDLNTRSTTLNMQFFEPHYPILQNRKPRLREVNGPTQDFTAVSGRVLPPGLSAAKASLLSAVLGEGQAGVQGSQLSWCHI